MRACVRVCMRACVLNVCMRACILGNSTMQMLDFSAYNILL